MNNKTSDFSKKYQIAVLLLFSIILFFLLSFVISLPAKGLKTEEGLKCHVEITKKYNEHAVVVNSVLAHHEGAEPISPISVLVTAADRISGVRPGARRESLEAYAQRITKLEELGCRLLNSTLPRGSLTANGTMRLGIPR